MSYVSAISTCGGFGVLVVHRGAEHEVLQGGEGGKRWKTGRSGLKGIGRREKDTDPAERATDGVIRSRTLQSLLIIG